MQLQPAETEAVSSPKSGSVRRRVKPRSDKPDPQKLARRRLNMSRRYRRVTPHNSSCGESTPKPVPDAVRRNSGGMWRSSKAKSATAQHSSWNRYVIIVMVPATVQPRPTKTRAIGTATVICSTYTLLLPTVAT
jgi:hypothetical protein